jgi:hypothetical protein
MRKSSIKISLSGLSDQLSKISGVGWKAKTAENRALFYTFQPF